MELHHLIKTYRHENLSGIDFNAEYNFDAAGLSMESELLETSYISKWEVQEFAGEPLQDYVGVASVS